MAAAPAESCQFVALGGSPWGRLGSVLYTCNRLHRIRRGFEQAFLVDFSQQILPRSGFQGSLGALDCRVDGGAAGAPRGIGRSRAASRSGFLARSSFASVFVVSMESCYEYIWRGGARIAASTPTRRCSSPQHRPGRGQRAEQNYATLR